MFNNVISVGTYVFILFILIAIGFVSNKTKILSEKSSKDITNLVMYVVTPCVIINSFRREFDPTLLRGLIITVIASVLSFAINILLAHLVIHDKDSKRERTLRCGVVFSNCGYMSLPLQEALLGSEGVFFGAIYIAIFQITLWTYGVMLMSGNFKNVSPKKILINPGVIGTAIGMVIFLCSLNIPFVIGEPIKYMASLNTPLPMIIIGYHLANASFKLRGINTYLSIFLRLIVSPLIMLGGLYLCGVTGTILVACTIAASAPFAAIVTMFSDKFGCDTPLSATSVSLTTLISIITMPIIVGLSTMVM